MGCCLLDHSPLLRALGGAAGARSPRGQHLVFASEGPQYTSHPWEEIQRSCQPRAKVRTTGHELEGSRLSRNTS
eukprot:7782734-Alexandrium_andersonii.AAC.1